MWHRRKIKRRRIWVGGRGWCGSSRRTSAPCKFLLSRVDGRGRLAAHLAPICVELNLRDASTRRWGCQGTDMRGRAAQVVCGRKRSGDRIRPYHGRAAVGHCQLVGDGLALEGAERRASAELGDGEENGAEASGKAGDERAARARSRRRWGGRGRCGFRGLLPEARGGRSVLTPN